MEQSEKYFQTRTNPIRRIKCVCILLSICCVPALIMASTRLISFLVVLPLVVCFYAFMIIKCKRESWFMMIFRNSTLTLKSNSSMMNYFFLDTLEIRDFTFSQSKSQAEKNRGSIRIRGLDFPLPDVENFSETKKYIEENF